MAKDDYYKILQVKKDDSIETIKKSYKKLALKYHPDKASEDKKKEYEESFKTINEAYSVIGDEKKRKLYDSGQTESFSQRSSTYGSNFSDIFNDIFSRGAFGNSFTNEVDPDLHYRILIDFKEAVFGTKKEISINRDALCNKCDGSGSDDGKLKTCEICGGDGRLEINQRTPFGTINRVVECTSCDGDGEIPENKCSNCKGEGILSRTEKVKVNIPKGIDNDQTLRVAGEGNVLKNGSKGDLFLEIQIAPSKTFRREGIDLYTTFPISFSQAALGDKVLVPMLDSKVVKIKIASGTESGSVLRIKGQGVPMVNRPDHRGDQFVKILVKTPKKLTSAQKKLFKELSELD